MSISLKLLFEDIHQAKEEDGLRSHLAPRIGEYFAAKRSAIFEGLVTTPKAWKLLDLLREL